MTVRMHQWCSPKKWSGGTPGNWSRNCSKECNLV